MNFLVQKIRSRIENIRRSDYNEHLDRCYLAGQAEGMANDVEDLLDGQLDAAHAMEHAIRDAITHEFSAGSIVELENARKRFLST